MKYKTLKKCDTCRDRWSPICGASVEFLSSSWVLDSDSRAFQFDNSSAASWMFDLSHLSLPSEPRFPHLQHDDRKT